MLGMFQVRSDGLWSGKVGRIAAGGNRGESRRVGTVLACGDGVRTFSVKGNDRIHLGSDEQSSSAGPQSGSVKFTGIKTLNARVRSLLSI